MSLSKALAYYGALVLALASAGCVGFGGGNTVETDNGAVYNLEKIPQMTINEQLASDPDNLPEDFIITEEVYAASEVTDETPELSRIMKVIEMRGQGEVLYPTISPDGLFVIFGKMDNNIGGISLYRQNVSGGSQLRLTYGPYLDLYPTISPDGKYIYFSSNRGGSFSIWRIGLWQDGNMRQITRHRNSDFAPAISPEGDRIAFHSYAPAAEFPRVWTCESDGTLLTPLEKGIRPRWSNDGKRLLFLTMDEDGEYMDIASLDPKEGLLTRMTNNRHVQSASWTPRGQIIYSDLNEESDEPNYDIWLGRKRLTYNPSSDQCPIIDNYGRLFFRSNRGGSFDYWMTDPVEE